MGSIGFEADVTYFLCKAQIPNWSNHWHCVSL